MKIQPINKCVHDNNYLNNDGGGETSGTGDTGSNSVYCFGTQEWSASPTPYSGGDAVPYYLQPQVCDPYSTNTGNDSTNWLNDLKNQAANDLGTGDSNGYTDANVGNGVYRNGASADEIIKGINAFLGAAGKLINTKGKNTGGTKVVTGQDTNNNGGGNQQGMTDMQKYLMFGGIGIGVLMLTGIIILVAKTNK